MGETKIEWADATWNPVTGCTKVSPGCAHCYAERGSKRQAGRNGYPKDEPFRVTLHPDRLTEPLHWKKPRRIFPCSMSDIFHPDIPDLYRAAIFGIMAATPRHTYMVLTKRPEAALEWFDSVEHRAERLVSIFPDDDLDWRRRHMFRAAAVNEGISDLPGIPDPAPWPLPNVWVGVTAEDQKRADERIPALLSIPAAVRFASVEPMLTPIKLHRYLKWPVSKAWALDGDPGVYGKYRWEKQCLVLKGRVGLDGVIGGYETGPRARAGHPDWMRDLRDQCQASGTDFFFKHWGEFREVRRYESWPQYLNHVGRISRAIGSTASGRAALLNADGSPLVNGGPEHKVYPISHLERVGKKVAGRELDGRTWDELPGAMPL